MKNIEIKSLKIMEEMKIIQNKVEKLSHEDLLQAYTTLCGICGGEDLRTNVIYYEILYRIGKFDQAKNIARDMTLRKDLSWDEVYQELGKIINL